MRNRWVYTCFILVILWGVRFDLTAQNSYQTDLLGRMATYMKLASTFETLKDGTYWKHFSFNGKPITVIVRNGRIEHIGYALFTPYLRSTFSSPVFNFLERYTLEIDLPLNREKEVVRQIAEDDISFDKGTFAFFQTLLRDTTFLVQIDNDGKRYTVSWHKNNLAHCSIHFPISFDLLNGSEMLENERRIRADIWADPLCQVVSVQVSRKQLLPTWQSNYFILPGESYYTDSLNTNRYYEQDPEGNFRLMYHAKYPLESLANLFTTSEIENQFAIDIRLKKYGYQEELMNIPLNRWVSFCLNNGCKPFFGVISFDGNVAECELIMQNKNQGYDHAMRITFDISLLENRKGVVQARLNSYVPTSKIKYLFDEIKQ